VLFLTCTGVSYFHGSNDGQKGVGLIMLILIGILPAQYALNSSFDAAKVNQTVAAVRQLEVTVQAISVRTGDAALAETQAKLAGIRTALTDQPSLRALSAEQRTGIRANILRVDDSLGKLLKADTSLLTAEEKKAITDGQKQMKATVDFVVPWVVVAVACALGLGTTVGWKRIVVTVGEKIGKTHLTYAQGASAELVAMSMIAIGDMYGLPVSTTHVLSSGIAGTMAANRSGIQGKTIRNIALAWVLTLPVTMLLSATLFSLTARSAMADIGDKARVTPRTERIPRKLE
jgi:PiT family inorganic phosphate transporter